mgnify:CR=1 FL=1
MKFSELENGMAVEFTNGDIGMVYKGFMTHDYMGRKGKYIALNGSDLDPSLESLNIKEIRSARTYCNSTYLKPETMFNKGDLVWQQSETAEMTLTEVCKALGKNIKIIK